MAMTVKELQMMEDLKENHPPYFEAVMSAIAVIVPRNKKYTGTQREKDLFANFNLTAEILGTDTRQVFKNWLAIKLARILLNDQDYADENFVDSLRDLANYALLYVGYLQQPNPADITSINFGDAKTLLLGLGRAEDTYDISKTDGDSS